MSLVGWPPEDHYYEPDYHYREWQVTISEDAPFERCRTCRGRGMVINSHRTWNGYEYRDQSPGRHCTTCDGRGVVDKPA